MMLLFIFFVLSSIYFPDIHAQCLCSDWINDEVNETSSPPPILTNGILDYRLPTWLQPVHYDLQIQPFLCAENSTFTGQVIAWFNLTQETNLITMHSHQLDIDQVEILMEDDNRFAPLITNVTFDEKRDFLLIETGQNLDVNKLYGVEIFFSGKMNPSELKGFAVSYYSMDGITRYVGVTHFEPTNARAVFPCFDEPGLKATFNVSIVRPFNMTSLSNMPLISSVSRDNQWNIDYFDKSPRMSTYTLAFAVSDLDYVQVEAGETLIRIWARPDAINQTALALKYAPKMLLFLEKYFGIPYSLPKLDIFSIPNVNFGAMENWGLITFADNNLLFDPKKNDEDNSFTVLTFLAHEIAHQWFGNLVTMKWWNDIWLNEGVTTYISYIVYEEVVENKPDWYKFIAWQVLNELFGWEMAASVQPLSFENLTMAEINLIFTRITYLKGSVVTRMMEKFAGSDVLVNGLRKYIKENMYGSTEQDDLWIKISEELKVAGVDLNVKEIMDTWTKQVGLPIITVTRNYEEQTAYVRQKLFSDKRQEKLFANDTKWTIPLMFTTKHSKDVDYKTTKWLFKDEKYTILNASDGIPGPDEWILFNPTFHGYYLVNYDNRNWKMLINQLIKNHTVLPAPIRMSMLFTLNILKINDFIPTALSYSIFEYFRNEKDATILFGGIQPLFELAKTFQATPHYHLFKKYLRHLITPLWIYITSELEGIDVDGPPRFLKHSIYKLACMAGIQDCLDKVREVLFSLMLNNTSDPLNRHIVNEDTMCALIHSLSQSEWENWLTLKSNLTYATMHSRYSLSKIMPCTSNTELLYTMLSKALNFENENLTDLDQRSLMQSMSNNYFNRRLAFDLLKENWENFANRPKTFVFVKILAENFTSRKEINELKHLLSCSLQEFSPEDQEFYRHLVKNVEQYIDKTEENVNIHLNWLEKTLKQIENQYGE